MLQKIKHLEGHTLGATDGEIGKVTDFFFDDQTWTIRYLVVKTGSWLLGRKVLISPQAVMGIDGEKELFNVTLTKEQIKHSPDVDTEQPVSRQKETELNQHYLWENYWGDPVSGISMMDIRMTSPMLEASDQRESESKPFHQASGDPHLQSCDEIKSYVIDANDGSIGEVYDFIINDKTWKIIFIAVETGNWLSGKQVLLSPRSIENLQWDRSAVKVNLSLDRVKNSPEYHPGQPISEAYAQALSSYFGQYWQ